LHIYSFDNDTMIAIKSKNNLGEKKVEDAVRVRLG
jgi:hypothetical protein